MEPVPRQGPTQACISSSQSHIQIFLLHNKYNSNFSHQVRKTLGKTFITGELGEWKLLLRYSGTTSLNSTWPKYSKNKFGWMEELLYKCKNAPNWCLLSYCDVEFESRRSGWKSVCCVADGVHRVSALLLLCNCVFPVLWMFFFCSGYQRGFLQNRTEKTCQQTIRGSCQSGSKRNCCFFTDIFVRYFILFAFLCTLMKNVKKTTFNVMRLLLFYGYFTSSCSHNFMLVWGVCSIKYISSFFYFMHVSRFVFCSFFNAYLEHCKSSTRQRHRRGVWHLSGINHRWNVSLAPCWWHHRDKCWIGITTDYVVLWPERHTDATEKTLFIHISVRRGAPMWGMWSDL